MFFEVILEPTALIDVQEAIDYYDEKRLGLGIDFEDELDQRLSILKKSPYFQIRYQDIRCLPLQRFPYMIHYSIDEKNKKVIVRAVFNTSIDPDYWNKR